MKDPYSVLGISPTASDDEVKKAYRDLARKYHPDKYAGSDLAELAEEKMKEVNAAYDEILSMRSGAKSNNSGGSYGGFSANEQGGNELYSKVRRAINSGDVVSAENLLLSVHEGDRGAEWNFLYGCVCYRKGYYVDAQRYFDLASAQDPTNAEYAQASRMVRNRASGFGSGYANETHGNCSGCDVCSSLLCADCCCECMGGDLIRCC